MLVFLVLSYCISISGFYMASRDRHLVLGYHKLRFDDACDQVCLDLPEDDLQPVCMMFSRFKKGYQFFANQCHARRATCKENLILHMVHPSRCVKARQFFNLVN